MLGELLHSRSRSIGYPRVMHALPVRPLSEVMAESPGCWIAIHRGTNAPLAIADSPYALAAKIREMQLHGIAVLRAPTPDEPELVGLG